MNRALSQGRNRPIVSVRDALTGCFWHRKSTGAAAEYSRAGGDRCAESSCAGTGLRRGCHVLSSGRAHSGLSAYSGRRTEEREGLLRVALHGARAAVVESRLCDDNNRALIADCADSPTAACTESSMPELKTMMTGISFGEQPRWHENRLWFSDWGSREVIAVDL